MHSMEPRAWIIPFAFAFFLGAIFQGCFGVHPAYGSAGISASAERMADALERLAKLEEREFEMRHGMKP